jgi:GNAT superfamily N-acetyltransferase
VRRVIARQRIISIDMDLVPYDGSHREACLALFDANSPQWFHPTERPGYEAILDQPPGPYLVACHGSRLIAAGGWAGNRIYWLMVDPAAQGQGVGRFLVLYLLREIGRAGHATAALGTTPAVTGFYEKFGFRSVERIADGYAPGMDRVEMVKKMDVCA